MKTNYFKILMPFIAIMIAIAGSFATQAAEKKISGPETGYYGTNWWSPCARTAQCVSPGAIMCTAIYGGQTYNCYGKLDPNDTSCTLVLYRP